MKITFIPKNIYYKSDLFALINDDTRFIKSQSLLFAFILYYHVDQKTDHYPSDDFLEFVKECFKYSTEYLPLRVVSGKMNDSLEKIKYLITNYTNSKDSKNANLINRIIMTSYYYCFYKRNKEYSSYFNYYYNNNVTMSMIIELIKETLNDIGELFNAPAINVKEYVYGIDGLTDVRENAKLKFNNKTVYLKLSPINNLHYDKEEIMIELILKVIAEYIVYLVNDNRNRYNLFNLTGNPNNFNQEYNYLYNTLCIYFEVYLGVLPKTN